MTAPEPRPTIDEQNPWPGLAPFEESAERFFNGRHEENAALRRLVLQAPLTVLFGASGLGKTSLLHAGLFPSLRKEALPVYVRLDLRDREAPLIEQVTLLGPRPRPLWVRRQSGKEIDRGEAGGVARLLKR